MCQNGDSVRRVYRVIQQRKQQKNTKKTVNSRNAAEAREIVNDLMKDGGDGMLTMTVMLNT